MMGRSNQGAMIVMTIRWWPVLLLSQYLTFRSSTVLPHIIPIITRKQHSATPSLMLVNGFVPISSSSFHHSRKTLDTPTSCHVLSTKCYTLRQKQQLMKSTATLMKYQPTQRLGHLFQAQRSPEQRTERTKKTITFVKKLFRKATELDDDTVTTEFEVDATETSTNNGKIPKYRQLKAEELPRSSFLSGIININIVNSERLLRRRDRFVRLFGIVLDDEQTKEVQQYRRMKHMVRKRKKQRQLQRQQQQQQQNVFTSSSLSSPSSRLQPNRLDNDVHQNAKISTKKENKNIITTIQELDDHWNDTKGLYRKHRRNTTTDNPIDYTALVRAAYVAGDTQMIGSSHHKDYTHPVAKLMHERYQTLLSSPNNITKVNDGYKIALAVEGGGMRGCVSAGMVAAIHYLNLTNTIDAIYGSSAGTIVASYLITKQLPWYGPEVYYDCLTTAKRRFIDTNRLLRAIGFGLLDPRFYNDIISSSTKEADKPVLNLHFLLKETVQQTKQLNWDYFVKRQSDIPLNVIVSALQEERSIALNMKNGAFTTLDELTSAMHGSCLLPGIAGPIMNVHKKCYNPTYNIGENKDVPKYILANKLYEENKNYEPVADALLYEPLPYRTALDDNATHVLVVRSRADGTDVTGKGGIAETLIAHRFFKRKNHLPNIYRRLRQHIHKKIYAEDVIRLNHEAKTSRYYKQQKDGNNNIIEPPHLMTVAIEPGSAEVSRLEVSRKAIFEGIRRGFARAYDCLTPDPNQRGKGAEIAKLFFPDEILEYDPLIMQSVSENMNDASFTKYMKQNNTYPKLWKQYYEKFPDKLDNACDETILLPPPPPLLS